MPELPEVAAVARRLQESAAGRTIVSAKFLFARTTRPQSGTSLARRLKNRKILKVTRRAKNILIHLPDDDLLRIHLGMTGELYTADAGSEVSARARFALDDGREIIFEDSRHLGRVNLIHPRDLPAFEKGYGVEPLSDKFTEEWLRERAAGSRKPAKLFLMDQAQIAGLGNIWAAESLFAARISPLRAMNSLKPAKLRELHAAIREVLQAAVDSAYLNYSNPGETERGSSFPVAVYGRAGEPCLRCQKKIKRVVQGGRSTYYCPSCQR